MYNIQVHVPYEKQQYIKKLSESLYYYLPIIPLSQTAHPRPQLTHTHKRTHTNMKQVAVGMYKSIRRLGGGNAFLG